MKYKKTVITLGVLALVQTESLLAVPPSPVPAIETMTSARHNDAYAGLSWSFDQSFKPKAVIGFRHAKVNSSGDADGSDLSLSFKFLDGFQSEKLRAKYFNGNEAIQGEAAGGYDFNSGIFVGVSVNGPFVNLGADYSVKATNSPFSEFIMVDTLKKYDKPLPGKQCPDISPFIYELSGSTCILLAPSDRRLKRDIHLLATLENGLKIYSFKYLWSDKTYVGVMAQELLENEDWKDAVITQSNGFYAVNYAMLGLQMTTLENWKYKGRAAIQLDEKLSLLNWTTTGAM